MKRIDLKIIFDCNNFCRFCAQGHKRENVRRRSPAEIRALLARARREGAEGVVFTGGEPTLHPWLPGAARAARSLGYKSVQVQSNGRRFSYPDYCEELREAGVTEMGPSLHGSSAEVHEGLTGARGSFAQVVKGILNCKRLGMFVLTNSVITSRNYRDLPALARLLLKLGVDQYQLAFVHLVGSAFENRGEIVPRKTDVMPFVRRALDAGIKKGVPCYTEAIPFCLMKGYEQCVAESMMPEASVADAGMYVKDFGKWRRTEGKAKRAECGRCARTKVCEGPWREYPEMFGWDEFAPVRR